LAFLISAQSEGERGKKINAILRIYNHYECKKIIIIIIIIWQGRKKKFAVVAMNE
jgi:hypothetical protein